MKSNAKVTHVEKEALVIDNTKYFKTSFIDDDGFNGVFYTKDLLKFGDDCVVELVENGGKVKFRRVSK